MLLQRPILLNLLLPLLDHLLPGCARLSIYLCLQDCLTARNVELCCQEVLLLLRCDRLVKSDGQARVVPTAAVQRIFALAELLLVLDLPVDDGSQMVLSELAANLTWQWI